MIDLRQGDCLELMKDIPDKSIDLIVDELLNKMQELEGDSNE